MITHSQYMADSANLHSAYYGQFVTKEIKEMVIKRFGIKNLSREFKNDKFLNGIPLQSWDRLAGNYINSNGGYASHFCALALKKAGDGSTWANAVCILKEAARMIIKENS